MPEELLISDGKDYVEIRSYGRTSVHELKHAIRDSMRIYRERGLTGVLVDARERYGMPTILNAIDGGEFLASLTRGKLRFAVVVREITDDHRFFEDIIINKGGRIAYFESYESALKWLSAGKQKAEW